MLSPTEYADLIKNGSIKNGGESDIIIPSYGLFNGKNNYTTSIGLANFYIIIKLATTT